MKTARVLLATLPLWPVVGGGALAAAPVDYGKMCDAGFIYVPGTTTCIQVSGYVRWEEKYNFLTKGWSLKGTAKVNGDIRIGTDYGTLRAFASGHFNTVPERVWDDRYLQFTGNGMDAASLLAGWTGSTFDYDGGYTYEGGYQSDASPVRQIRYTLRGGVFSVAVEDQRDREIGDAPAFVLSVTPNTPWNFTGSLAVGDTPYGMGWAAQAGVTVKVTDRLSWRTVVAFADKAQSYVGLDGAADATAWSALTTARWAPTSWFYLAGTLSYADSSIDDPVVQATGGAYVRPIPPALVGAEVTYKGAAAGGGAETATLRAQYNFP